MDLLPPRLEPCWCQPISKPIGFLCAPFAFEWIYNEVVILKNGEDFAERGQVLIPANVVDLTVDFIVISENVLDDFLCNIG